MIKTFLLSLAVLIFSACSDTKPKKLLINLVLAENTPSTLSTNANHQLKIYAVFDDGSTEDITNTLEYSSSDESIASVSSQGYITTKENNTSTNVIIFYNTKEKAKDNTPLLSSEKTFNIKTLTIDSITLDPNTQQFLNVGSSLALKANALYENNTTLTVSQFCNWQSSDSSIVSVNNTGIISALKEGNATVSATSKINSDKNSSIAISVFKTLYTTLQLKASKTRFNVGQDIELEVYAITDKNTTVVLTHSDLLRWKSENEEVISLNTSLAHAEKKGTTKVHVSLNYEDNSTISDTLTLEVISDHYLRIWQNSKELSFPYSEYYYSDLDGESDTFTMQAQGEDLTLKTLYVINKEDVNISSGAKFKDLSISQKLLKDENVTFTLERSDDSLDWLEFYFQIDDETRSDFSVKYLEPN